VSRLYPTHRSAVKLRQFTVYLLRRRGQYLWRYREWHDAISDNERFPSGPDFGAVRFLYRHSAANCAAELGLDDIEIVEHIIYEPGSHTMPVANAVRIRLPFMSRFECSLAIRPQCAEAAYP
jgi:hypothetical protein